jgi:hypothetical protein
MLATDKRGHLLRFTIKLPPLGIEAAWVFRVLGTIHRFGFGAPDFFKG